MESPEGDRINAISSTPSSSPAVQESPFTVFVSNLSPIKSVKAARYTPRFPETHFRTPPQVFKTPRLDQRETSFLKSNKKDAAGSDACGKPGNQSDIMLNTCFQNEVQQGSPSVCVDEYLNDSVEAEKDTAANERDLESSDRLLQLTSEKINDQVESNKSLISGAQYYDQYVSQNVEWQNAGIQHSDRDGNFQSMPEAFQSDEVFDCPESSIPASIQEAASNQRGIRRHLQFEAAMANKGTTSSESDGSHNVTQGCANLRSPEADSLLPSHVELTRPSKTISSAYNAASQPSFGKPAFFRSTRPGGSLAISGPVPSGIGLHLNSVARSVSISSDMTSSKKFGGSTSSGEEKLSTSERSILARNQNSSLISPVAGDIYAHMDNVQQEDQTIQKISSATSHLIECVQPASSSHALPEQQSAPSEGRIVASQNTNSSESIQVSPKKRRKKAISNSESDGCKRCNCRRSKCLKLYCECFAAGVYCVDSCACENCFNKPEYEDTVLDTRQQIESRNPLAFAPKIVKQATDSPANVVEEGNWKTPASARHKRGCNCKKSKCLKKYCECFQANVGCSDGCRCEGCNNSFGRKADSMYRRAEIWENPSHVKRDTAEIVTDSTKSMTPNHFWEDLLDIGNFTPLSHSLSEALPSSASPSTSNYPNVSLSQSNQTSFHKSSTGQLRWRYSPMNFTPQLCDNKAANEFSSSGCELDGQMNDDDMPRILKDGSTPKKAFKASSPTQKRVSPPQYRSGELRSRSNSPGLRSGRKFILQAVPSFPPLSPYSKSKDGISQCGTDFNESTDY